MNLADQQQNGTEKRKLTKLSIAALGVVFGDIGTSPLYAIRECFHGEFAISVNAANVYGVLSLMVWALILIVSIKYLSFILRADNNGEGGVLALTALVRPFFSKKMSKSGWLLISLGIFAGALLYGDGMITPAISVLSAVEGIREITNFFDPYVIPITIGILAALFLFQRKGTASVGSLFGPIIFVWFSVLAILGIFEIVKNPDVLIAINPVYAIEFLIQNKLAGFLVLGAVFLVVTGAEALYADLGHFGRKPIRITWIGIVLPALLLNYFGQGALLLSRPAQAYHPFYGMVPSWAIIPMVVLATTATIIASQAVITGAFSLTRQSIQLGFLPRMKVIHTSAEQIGQIYVPQVNWLLMIATIFLVVEFRTSDKLAAAYGVAVTSTMLITTLLFYVIARRKWGWSKLAAGGLFVIFFITDLAFFGANMSKIMHGAWFPLVVAGAIFALMSTWQKGRQLLYEQLSKEALTLEDFIKSLSLQPVDRVRGQAIFLSGNPGIIPRALLHNLKHNKILHSEIIFLHISTEEVPRIPLDQKLDFEKLGSGFYKVNARYGFMEEPNIVKILTLIREKGVDFKPNQISYFLGREMVLPKEKSGMSRWRTKLFAFMSHNAFGFTAYYDIPPNQVVELGSQIRL